MSKSKDRLACAVIFPQYHIICISYSKVCLDYWRTSKRHITYLKRSTLSTWNYQCILFECYAIYFIGLNVGANSCSNYLQFYDTLLTISVIHDRHFSSCSWPPCKGPNLEGCVSSPPTKIIIKRGQGYLIMKNNSFFIKGQPWLLSSYLQEWNLKFERSMGH